MINLLRAKPIPADGWRRCVRTGVPVKPMRPWQPQGLRSMRFPDTLNSSSSALDFCG